MNRTFATFIALIGLSAVAAAAYAGDPQQAQDAKQQASREQPAAAANQADQTAATKQTDQVYGWQLMSPQERIEYRNKMRSLQTQEQREALRLEHHQKMQERAREKGVTLPAAPPGRAKGMGQGGGMGRNRLATPPPAGQQQGQQGQQDPQNTSPGP